MSKKLDLTGQKFGRLTVVKEVEAYVSPKGKKYSKWFCKCECGNTKEIQISSLRRGVSISCGCYQKEVVGSINFKHGQSNNSKEYQAWCNAKTRCYNTKYKDYFNYGGRGITMCDEWNNSFEVFLKDVGKCPGPEYSLDRIDVNGNYEPSNVMWVISTVQKINRRIFKNNSSGVKGVHWNKKLKKWVAQIKVNYKYIYLGCFININEAIAARLAAEEIHHKPLLKEAT